MVHCISSLVEGIFYKKTQDTATSLLFLVVLYQLLGQQISFSGAHTIFSEKRFSLQIFIF